ncbi:hypothetical protein A1O3_04632 [Capronia epimyces CBS 606.96]|uniref:Acyltransferase 3 domain-containing protein n=1 Tax=Capronia epimyces CBS 606.96 TaxID=1182542 RepID=W9Y2W2_9EURO|nr:uncharacterized protein A1O3_04632 [Capronia epimyces CBS 606.96]EXJ83965.1 hypothetical protein A1O3_04632 [Capronia epimyces CBS 606.96]
MVALFFVISGYALGYRFLVLIRKRDADRMLTALASSTFRRYIRLYASTGLACLIALVLVRLRMDDGMRAPIHKETFMDQLWNWIFDLVRFCNPFAEIIGWVNPKVFDSKYLGQMWSIPVEYRGSVALFSFCTAACKLTARDRMILTWIVIVVCNVWQAVYISGFMAGLFIADLSLKRHPERLAKQIPSNTPSGRLNTAENFSSRVRLGYVWLFMLGLFLSSQPDEVNLGILGPYPWRFLKGLVPAWWDKTRGHLFWNGIGALSLTYALEFYPSLQKPLHWRFSQYLGDLSFGIYATHPPVYIAVCQRMLQPFRQHYLGDSYIAYLPGFLITLWAVFTVADYFSRIDKAVVNFASRVQKTLFLDR